MGVGVAVGVELYNDSGMSVVVGVGTDVFITLGGSVTETKDTKGSEASDPCATSPVGSAPHDARRMLSNINTILDRSRVVNCLFN